MPFFGLAAVLSASLIAAQDTTPAPAPAPTSTPSFMDRAYDGQIHTTLAPYIWAPTVRANLTYEIPTLGPGKPHHVAYGSITAAPADYLPKLNSAAMFAFDVRKGDVNFFGDYIHLNASMSGSQTFTVSGPLGHVQVPINLSTSARLVSDDWEAALGFALAHGHNADVSLFGGYRQYPLNLTFSYTAIVGKKGLISPSGTVVSNTVAKDIIFGLRGKAFFGDDRWYVPYYAELGSGLGVQNQTWEAYGGLGYAFPHGQSFLLVYRDLTYYDLPPTSVFQRLTMAGPLFGYTFSL